MLLLNYMASFPEKIYCNFCYFLTWIFQIIYSCNFLAKIMKWSILQDRTPCILLKIYRRFGRACLYLQSRRISQVRKQQSRQALSKLRPIFNVFHSRPCIPENRTLHNHRCENLKFHNNEKSVPIKSTKLCDQLNKQHLLIYTVY
jgi:hypothetical protein